MRAVYVLLYPAMNKALRELADLNRRGVRQQASKMLEDELKRVGLLKDPEATAD